MGLWLPDDRMEMPELLHPNRKPVGNVKIDWGHNSGIQKGLKRFLLTEQTNHLLNLVDNSRILGDWGNDSTEHIEATDEGICYVTQAGVPVTFRLALDTTEVFDAGFEYTVVIRVRAHDLGIDHCLFDKQSSIAGTGHDLIFWLDTIAGNLRLALHSNGGTPIYSDVLDNPLGWNTLGFTYNDSNGTVKSYINGRQSSSGVLTDKPDTGGTFGTCVFSNYSAVGGKLANMDMGYHHSWDRVLSDIEMLSFSDNPYQLLIPA